MYREVSKGSDGNILYMVTYYQLSMIILNCSSYNGTLNIYLNSINYKQLDGVMYQSIRHAKSTLTMYESTVTVSCPALIRTRAGACCVGFAKYFTSSRATLSANSHQVISEAINSAAKPLLW